MSDQRVKKIGKYEIFEELGRGGFAVVYKAHDPDLNRTVALKVLAPHLTWDPSFAERFRREAQATANLRHAHIVTIYEVGGDDEHLYIAMEHLPGRTLAQLLGASGAAPVGYALSILEQIASALDYAHRQGVIHRDVKPSNVMVERTDQGVRATLMDFGLVKAMESSESLTSVGAALGSPEYMAPEQADPDRRDEIGPATDRYALGVVAYEMLTGRVPFPGSTPSTLVAHIQKPPPAPQTLREDLPEDVAQVLLKALSKVARERYPTARAMVEALRRTQARPMEPVEAVKRKPEVVSERPPARVVVEQETAPAETVARKEIAPRPRPAEARRKRPSIRRWVVAGVLVAALVAAGVGLRSLMRGGATPTPEATTAVAARPAHTQAATDTPTAPPRATDTQPVAVPPPETPTPTATDAPWATETPTATRISTPTSAPTATPEPPYFISGAVFTSDGIPLERIGLAATQEGENRVDGYSDVDGVFVMEVTRAGEWQVSIVSLSGEGGLPVWDEERSSLVDYFNLTPSQTVQVPPSADELEFMYERASATLAGMVHNADGSPASTVRVIAWRTDGASSWGNSDYSGSFALPAGPGTWTVSAVNFATGKSSAGVDIDLPPDATDIVLQLEP